MKGYGPNSECLVSTAWGISMAGRPLDPKSFGRWLAMIRRCYNPKERTYGLYGGRGIRVCDRWLTFSNYLADLGPRPDGKTLDRIDNDGDYSPENTRWADAKTQVRNMRNAPALRTHCPQGHLYDDVNTRYDKHGWRACRACDREASERDRRAAGVPIGNVAKTHCNQGHAFDEDNTYIVTRGALQARRCRACKRDRDRRRDRRSVKS